MTKIIPRDYQQELMNKVRDSLRSGKRRPIVVAATGAGKTVVFSAIANGASKKGKKVLILAHRDTLIKQASAKLRDYDVKHGIIMSGFTPNFIHNVQIASVQTLIRRIKSLRWHPDLIIIDEAHLSAAKSYLEIINFKDEVRCVDWSRAAVLGFTGSPCRLDNKPLGAASGGIYDDLIQAISISQLIDRGFLVRPVVYAPAEQLDLSGIKKSMGDFDTKQLAEVVDKPKLIGDAVNQYRKICNGVPAVAWCVTVQHAQHVADEFNANGIRAEMLCGDHDTAHRDKTLKKLETGEVKVITFVGILIEGVDCPAIGAILLLRPTMSLASYLQVIGRGLRPYKNKTVCYVVDHAGLSFRHGFADDDREWELNTEVKKSSKRKKEDEPVVAIAQCKACYACFQPAPICPHCGTPIEVRQRKIEHADGELQLITKEDIAKKQKRQEVGKAQSLEELQKIAAERGYSKGWAWHTYQAKSKRRGPTRAAEPSLDQLKRMSLPELQNVAAQQAWPSEWAIQFYNQNHTQ